MLKQEDLVKIIYPDSDDPRVISVVSDLLKEWETPVVCWTEEWREKYKTLIDKGLEYKVIPEGRTNQWYAAELLKEWTVQWYIGGNISTTADIVRALLKKVGTREWINRISSYFLMNNWERDFIFSDSWLAPNPSVEELFEILQLASENAIWHGILQPKIILLDGWFENSKIQETWEIAKRWVQENNLDIEIQIGGNLWEAFNNGYNIFLFHNLNAGNTAYKIAERMKWYQAWKQEFLYEDDIMVREFQKWDEKILFSFSMRQDFSHTDELVRVWIELIKRAQERWITPRVAFISYSTAWSWVGKKWPEKTLEPVIGAWEKLKEELNKLSITDVEVIREECQFDAAFIPETGRKKWVEISNSATIYIFPDKFTWSICADIPWSINGATAIWPLIQWLAAEGHDVSRGIDEETLKKMYEIVKHMILSKNK